MTDAKLNGSVAGVLCGLAVSFACVGATPTWLGDGLSHLTPTNAAVYETTSNWQDGVLPTATTGANFYNAAKGTYIHATNRIEARYVLTCNGSYAGSHDVIFIADGGITGSCPATQNMLWIGPIVYGDMETSSRLLTWTATLCGDYHSTAPLDNANGQLTLASETFSHRLDLYANQAGGARTNALDIANLYLGSGTFLFRAPQSCATNVFSAWNQTALSPFLFPSSAKATPILPAGTLVTGEGVPAGTFLKRIFPNGAI